MAVAVRSSYPTSYFMYASYWSRRHSFSGSHFVHHLLREHHPQSTRVVVLDALEYAASLRNLECAVDARASGRLHVVKVGKVAAFTCIISSLSDTVTLTLVHYARLTSRTRTP